MQGTVGKTFTQEGVKDLFFEEDEDCLVVDESYDPRDQRVFYVLTCDFLCEVLEEDIKIYE